MIPGETILGDDLAYFRILENSARAVNIESGIFGIIRDVNPKDDPAIFKVLSQPGEVIFGNVLVNEGRPYWEGMGRELPKSGTNYLGPWREGDKGPDGAKADPSHKNARYTVRVTDLQNLDPHWNDPAGVTVGGVIYGGRDSDTCVPVQESFDWAHGILTMGASLESETTAATIGAVGVRAFNLMSNLDFLAVPLGKYIQNNLDFGLALGNPPKVFGTNYFLRGADGKYLNGMLDKSIWIKWMELRVHGEAQAIDAPTGRIPRYEDLRKLFKTVLGKDYTPQQYVEQFAIRVPESLAKIDRIEAVYRKDVPDAPSVLYKTLEAQRARLKALQQAKGDRVSPENL
jgi:phosphoenolpyruvate carboxykinase (GTP)